MNECRTCELVERRNAGDAPPWDCVARTRGWDVVHAFGTSLERWIVLVVRRHIVSMAELTNDEALELGPLIKAVSAALHDIVGCEKTYVAQFANIRIIARAARTCRTTDAAPTCSARSVSRTIGAFVRFG